jgi:hypothetical protein
MTLIEAVKELINNNKTIGIRLSWWVPENVYLIIYQNELQWTGWKDLASNQRFYPKVLHVLDTQWELVLSEENMMSYLP